MREILVRVLKWEVELSTHCSSIRDMPQADSGAGFSQSLERGLAVLSSFTPERPELGISELARMLALTRSTTHRYVATLAALGYLHQDEDTRRYRLGPRVLDLGFAVLGSLELREIAAPHLRRLAETTGHTANLAVRDDTDAILIEPGPRPPLPVSPLRVQPAHRLAAAAVLQRHRQDPARLPAPPGTRPAAGRDRPHAARSPHADRQDRAARRAGAGAPHRDRGQRRGA